MILPKKRLKQILREERKTVATIADLAARREFKKACMGLNALQAKTSKLEGEIARLKEVIKNDREIN